MIADLRKNRGCDKDRPSNKDRDRNYKDKDQNYFNKDKD